MAVRNIIGLAFLALAACGPASAQTTPPLFTQEQADRGQDSYQRNCQDCHGGNLDDGEFGGAPLRGSYFSQHWGSGNVAALSGYMQLMMPPDRPGRLSPETYTDLTAFLLSKNGYAPGDKPLPGDAAAQQTMTMKK